MATIKATPYGNFDPNNSVTATFTTGVAIGDPSHSYILSLGSFGEYIIQDNTTQRAGNLVIQGRAGFLRDGISADFSDNTNQVNLTGGDRNDVLCGGSGDDTLNGGGGNDLLEGGIGTNMINGGAGLNTVSYEHYQGRGVPIGVRVDLEAGAARESFPIQFADSIQDTLIDMQNIRGSVFADVLRGDAKRNVIEGGGGADTIIGVGAGDFASYLDSADGVTVNLTTGTNTGGDAEGDGINGIQNIYGSLNADSLTGNGNANQIFGMGGADTIDGMGGNDTIFLKVTPTMVTGGDGIDILVVDTGGRVVLTNGNFSGFETIVVRNEATLDLSGAEEGVSGIIKSVSTSGRGATIIGSQGDDRIKAGGGTDMIDAGTGNDVIYGGSGAATVEGGAGNDVIFAGSGAETFDMQMAGFGRDVIRNANLSLDTFQVHGLADSFADLTFTQTGASTVITGADGTPGDALVLAGTSVAQAQGANFDFTAPPMS